MNGVGGEVGEVRAGLAEKRQLHHLFEGSVAAALGIIQFIYPGGVVGDDDQAAFFYIQMHLIEDLHICSLMSASCLLFFCLGFLLLFDFPFRHLKM